MYRPKLDTMPNAFKRSRRNKDEKTEEVVQGTEDSHERNETQALLASPWSLRTNYLDHSMTETNVEKQWSSQPGLRTALSDLSDDSDIRFPTIGLTKKKRRTSTNEKPGRNETFFVIRRHTVPSENPFLRLLQKSKEKQASSHSARSA
mmetsp:Transcript_22900/g.33956  ORF Transcript_22900/g.33956 Transcript_22900/m.33956 type:complete len:148 (+) Transcript_22900:149-592(+)